MLGGITLVALVVTIVILIILAVISINAVLGENGLIKQAERAAEFQANAEAADNEVMEYYDKYVANAIAGIGGNGGNGDNEGGTGGDGNDDTTEPELPEITDATTAGTPVQAPDSWTSTKVTAISDGGGTAIPLPDGFYYIGGDIETGLVISDKDGDTLDASGTSSGNQFVWIPVKSKEDLTRTNFDDNGNAGASAPSSGENYTDCSEPYASGYSDGNGTEETDEYNKMNENVLQYGGFYIGRYEAGINSTSFRSGTTGAQEVVSKKG